MKYIVCYPSEGLNDILITIDKCLIYAIKYNRRLIIDTTKFGWFKHDIHNYILFNHKLIHTGNNIEILKSLEQLTIFPDTMKNRLLTPTISNSDKLDLVKDYEEDVVVCFWLGLMGGTCKELLKHMTLKSNILNIYRYRLHKLPQSYTGIHIRNTDKKSNLPSFMNEHKNLFIEKSSTNESPTALFIASDDRVLLDHLKNTYKNVYTFSYIPKMSKGDTNIHYSNHKINHAEFIIDCFVDLLLLASGQEYIYSCKFTPKKYGSGYSRLAEILFQNNKEFLHKIAPDEIKNSNNMKNIEPNPTIATLQSIPIYMLPRRRI